MKQVTYSETLARAASVDLRLVSSWSWSRVDFESGLVAHFSLDGGKARAIVFEDPMRSDFVAEVRGEVRITGCPTVSAAQTAAEVYAALEPRELCSVHSGSSWCGGYCDLWATGQGKGPCVRGTLEA